MTGQRLDVAVSAARRAGSYLRGVSPTESGSEEIKESWHSIVTEHDIEAQRIVVDALLADDPGARIVSEELSGHDARSASPPCWIVDPIDGTSYFVRGLNSYSIAIAFVDDLGVAVGVVHCPASGELFYAERGSGAFLDGRRIGVSAVDDPRRAMFTFGHRFLRDILAWPGRLEILQTVRAVRAGGSCAQELAYLADGKIDGVIALSQSPWDYAAGMLLVTEAGGEITDLVGARPQISGIDANSQDIVATNRLLHPWCSTRMVRGRMAP